ncbi:MAG: TolC family protein, partial [Leptolyngbyaceae cyanobacterium CAN_BIN12]|nr:TolC family protein [Leptolyngbyaceae cyanobacterium CAN_BIN12]
MGSSYPLVAVGVGVLVALAHTTAGYSQEPDLNPSVDANEQSPAKPHSEKIDESPFSQSAVQSDRAIAGITKSERASEKTKLNNLNTQKKARRAISSSSPKTKPINPVKPINQTAQVDPRIPSSPATGTTPASVIPTLPVTPNIPVLPFQNIPIGPAKSGLPPEYLNPNPNPLSFPTRPEEVKLRGIQPITLQQALELAKRNNRDLQLSTEVLQRVRASLREAQAARYPTIGANGQISQSRSASGQLSEAAQTQAQQSLPPALQQNSNSDQQSTALNGTVQVGYDIYTSGRRPAQIRAVEQQVRGEELQVEVTLKQLQFDVSDAYYNLQGADESVRIQQSAVRNAEASLRDAAAQERAGIGTRLDVL